MHADESVAIVVTSDLYVNGPECIIPQPVITFRYPS